MSKLKIALIIVALIVIDLFVYSVLGVALMVYDDNYDGSRGEYWSWESMTLFDKTILIALFIWNIVNAVAVVYWLYKAYKKMKYKTVL